MSQVSFFASVQSFAKPFVKAVAASVDPITAARNKFTNVADAQIKLLKEKAAKGFWFRTVDGALQVSLKNGAAVLPKCSFQVKTAADAIKLLEAAKKSCDSGEFDQLFKDTARKPIVRKPKAAPAPAATAPTQPK